MKNNNPSTLKFRFDVSAYRLLGRELITDRITALFELVKNCYDANAENVSITFINVNPLSKNSRIIIEDDGIGMSFEDIRDKWMVIGTSSKRKSTKSPAPYLREVAGKKVDADKTICLETNWEDYTNEETSQLKLNFGESPVLFTDIENRYWYEEDIQKRHGTILEISGVADVWSESDIVRAIKELSKIIRPQFMMQYPFNVYVKAPQYQGYESVKIESQAIEHATFSISLNYDLKLGKQEILYVDANDNGILKKKLVPMRACGPIGLTIYYYDKKAKGKFKKITDDRIDGIKVYRDGLIATPFAEYNAKRDEQKDLFGIDKRRWSGFFDKISTRDLLGWVEISKEYNPDVIDATNRQDFVDNEAWKSLKAFVIEQICKIEESLKLQKQKQKEKVRVDYTEANEDLDIAKQTISLLINSADPNNKETLETLSRYITKASIAFKKGLVEYAKLQEEKRRQEDLLFSLVSLQTYASMLAHITRTSIGRIKHYVEFIYKWIDSDHIDKKKYCSKYGLEVFNEMNNLDRAVDFMLKYAKDDQDFTSINIKESLEDIFKVYAPEFESQSIQVVLEVNKELTINYNLKAFQDIIDNLISNSIKALKYSKSKLIKCTGIVQKDDFVILFSDNGCGIDEENKDRVFDVFYTTTVELVWDCI